MWSDAFRLALVLAAAWILPGYLLGRLLGVIDRRWLPAPALCVTLGLGWLLLPAVAVLALHGNLVLMTRVTAALDAALLAVAAVQAWRGALPRPAPAEPPTTTPGLSRAVAVLAGLAALAVLVFRVTRVRHFTFLGDEWVLMQNIRYFIEAPRILDTFTMEVWSLVIAFLVRVSGAQLLDVYGTYLPLVLVVAACASFLFLASTVLESLGWACLALALQALYCLSDMQPRGEGAGMGLVVRIVEDKYLSVLVLVPVAQALFLRWLRRPRAGDLVAAGMAFMTALLVHPLALLWLGLSCGPTYLAVLWIRRAWPALRTVIGLGALLAAAVGAAWWIRAGREASYFVLNDPSWAYSRTLLALSRNQLWVLSEARGWYMGDPILLRHPLVMAALVAALLLIRWFRVVPAVPFVVLGTWVPVAVVFNPLTATAVGRGISPWMVYRLLWVVPVSLALVLLGQRLVEAWAGRRPTPTPVPARWSGAAPALIGVVGLALAALLLAPRIEESWQAVRSRNRIPVRGKEREILAAAAHSLPPGSSVLAPGHLSIELPVWTSRLHPYPGLETYRGGYLPLVEVCTRFYEASTVDVALLRKFSIGYVIVEAESPLEDSCLRQPALFKRLYRGSKFALYAFRPERGAAGAG